MRWRLVWWFWLGVCFWLIGGLSLEHSISRGGWRGWSRLATKRLLVQPALEACCWNVARGTSKSPRNWGHVPLHSLHTYLDWGGRRDERDYRHEVQGNGHIFQRCRLTLMCYLYTPSNYPRPIFVWLRAVPMQTPLIESKPQRLHHKKLYFPIQSVLFWFIWHTCLSHIHSWFAWRLGV